MMYWRVSRRASEDAPFIDDIPLEFVAKVAVELPSEGSKKFLFNGKKYRAVRRSSELFTALGIFQGTDHFNSKSLAERETENMLIAAKSTEGYLAKVVDRAESQTRRLIHNLRSLNAKTMQEIFYVVRQDELQKSFGRALNYVEQQIKERPGEAAEALLLILKHQAAQKSEFSAFEKLSGKISGLKKEKHSIHKILMNVFYLFFKDFSEKSINARVEHTDIKVFADYESVHAIVFHLVDNAAKYVRSGGSIAVSARISGDLVDVAFDMDSLLIEGVESEKIFDEGFSGRLAKSKQLHGSGIGLTVARQLAHMNGGNVSVLPGAMRKTDQEYSRNRFVLTLPSR